MKNVYKPLNSTTLLCPPPILSCLLAIARNLFEKGGDFSLLEKLRRMFISSLKRRYEIFN